MNSHVYRYYRKLSDEDTPIRLFHEVINLNEATDLSWLDASKKVPKLPKGWFELSRLSVADRIEFTKEFWLNHLPFTPKVHEYLEYFFSGLDDVGVYLTQLLFDSPFECEIVYSLRDGSCFFHGYAPCLESQISSLRKEFHDNLPEDFLSFLLIHDGFSKHNDTGIIRSAEMIPVWHQLQHELEKENAVIFCKDRIIDPKGLIPFYQFFGTYNYQCFYADWRPTQEVGNVFYSQNEHNISDFHDFRFWQENLAFPTFLDWLVFYLEGIES